MKFRGEGVRVAEVVEDVGIEEISAETDSL